jgi:hypothetical protein
MRWHLSWRADPRAAALADRHYNRQSIGAAQFVPPGRCLVLVTTDYDALWVTSWPLAAYVKHRWPGAWMCSVFRKEGVGRASDFITEAIAATIWYFGPPPEIGMVTFVDRDEVRPKRDPGRCFLRAGFEPCGETAGGLLAFRMRPERMPQSEMPIGSSKDLWVNR